MCIGFVPNYSKSDSRGKKLLEQSGHHALYLLPAEKEEGIEIELVGDYDDDASGKIRWDPEEEYSLRSDKAQDLHKILAALMLTYQELQKEGMVWDYKYRGKVYKNVELVFFLSHVKCDGDEADKLTGHFRSRGVKVKCLCRYCCCPTADGDSHLANYKLKTKAMIKGLVERNNERSQAALKEISQQNIKNAFDDVQFGLHNELGIHGSCPMEMLHHILLGIFKYMRDQFFIQIGLKSQVAQEINALAKLLGRLFARQSERDLPKTNFAKGIFEGKIMGKEFCGVLLLIAAILQTTMGNDLLRKKRGQQFKTQEKRDDWALLVETLLCWETYLKLDRMELKHVKRLKQKHRYLMYLIKKIMLRTKGVGFKFMKFHGILHMVMDMMAYGVPSNVDTGANESHHKFVKLMAKLTQRDISVFEKQTASRLVEFLLLDMAMAELDGKTMWEYFVLDQDRGPLNFVETPDNEGERDTGGAAMKVCEDEDGEIIAKYRRSNGRDVVWGDDIVEFLGNLQTKVQQEVGIPSLDIRTEHKRDGKIFRAHPNYRNKGIWNDWAIFDWGKHWGKLPCEIWCFVDFSEAGDDFSFRFADCHVQRGVYAVIESSSYEEIPEYPVARESELFTPIIKERQFYLADVESIVDTCCVIPDVGSPNHLRYFTVEPRRKWAALFVEWLMERHTDEKEEMKVDAEEEED